MTPSQSSPPGQVRRGSIRTQLIAGSIAILALLLGGFGLFIRYTVAATLMQSVDRELDQRTRPMAVSPAGPMMPPPPPPPLRQPPGIQPAGDNSFQPPQPPGQDFPHGPGGPRPGFPAPPNPPPGPPPTPADGGFGGPANRAALNPYRPRRFDRDGKPAGPDRGDSEAVLWDPVSFAQSLGGATRYSFINHGDVTLRVISRPFPSSGPVRGVIQAAYPMTETYAAIAGVDRALLILIPVALLCAAGGGYLITQRVLIRVRQMARAAGQMEAQDLSQRLPVSGNDEFSELAVIFNGLLGRVDTAFRKQSELIEQQRRFTADASHELKTPLTIIQGTTSMALAGGDGSLDRESVEEIDRAALSMSQLVQDLLTLARYDAGQLGRDPVELPVEELLQRAVAQAAPRSKAAISLAPPATPLLIRANSAEMLRLFSNLLDNAARYTPAGGKIVVAAVESMAGGEWVEVTVADTGIGVAAEHLPHLTERFYRVDASRTRGKGDLSGDGGTGLGLSICKSIAESAGGSLRIESELGKGTRVTVLLPRIGSD